MSGFMKHVIRGLDRVLYKKKIGVKLHMSVFVVLQYMS